MTELGDFPLDDMTLGLLEEAARTGLDLDEAGELVPVGGGFTLSRLLEFQSGYDPADVESLEDRAGIEPDPRDGVWSRSAIYSTTDVILALVAEVRRLRTVPEDVEYEYRDLVEFCETCSHRSWWHRHDGCGQSRCACQVFNEPACAVERRLVWPWEPAPDAG